MKEIKYLDSFYKNIIDATMFMFVNKYTSASNLIFLYFQSLGYARQSTFFTYEIISVEMNDLQINFYINNENIKYLCKAF